MMFLYNYRCILYLCTAFFAITNCLFNVGLASILGLNCIRFYGLRGGTDLSKKFDYIVVVVYYERTSASHT